MLKSNESYLGWSNWESWACNLWITNQEFSYNYFKEIAETSTFSHFKEELKCWLKLHDFDGLAGYVNSINYREIFRSLRADL